MVKTCLPVQGNLRDAGSIPGWGRWVQSLDGEDPLEEGKAIHSSILTWRIPQRSQAGYISWGCKESDTAERACMLVNENQLGFS